MRLSRASEPAPTPRTLSGELTLTEAALRVDLSGERCYTVLDHRGRPVGTFDASLLRAIPLVERAALLVSDVARRSEEPAPDAAHHPRLHVGIRLESPAPDREDRP